MTKSHHNLQNWLLLVALTLIWGTSYILIKKGLIAFTPLQLGCLRLSISGVCAIPITIKMWRPMPLKKYGLITLVGILSSGLPAFLFPLSITKSETSVAGILNSLSPLWTVIVGYLLYQVKISAQKTVGVFIGFAGAVVLVLGKPNAEFKVNLLYSLYPVLATLCYGLASNITKQKLQQDNSTFITAMTMSIVGLMSLSGLFFTGAPAVIAGGNAWFSVGCIAILGIFGTLIAWMLFYRLLQRTDALFAASVTYLVPIVAIAWGILDGEVLSLLQLLGFLLIITGVYFTTRIKTVSS